MNTSYDHSNIFARILRKEIPADVVYESPHSLAFKDTNPQRLVHVLLIPKGPYTSLYDFSLHASSEEVHDLIKAYSAVCRLYSIQEEGGRFLSNHGSNGRQEVPHLHFHILGGEDVGPMVSS